VQEPFALVVAWLGVERVIAHSTSSSELHQAVVTEVAFGVESGHTTGA
jgi:hypothetical protein